MDIGFKSIRYIQSKYTLMERYFAPVNYVTNMPVACVEGVFINKGGIITIMPGYTWDGTSGPIFDRDRNMRASLVHDALYTVLRNDKDNPHWESNREVADKLFKELCVKDGVPKWRAEVYYRTLRVFGHASASGPTGVNVKVAP